MASSASKTVSSLAKYKLSRRGKKLQFSDDQRTLLALPKDVPERTWAELLQKEETDLMIFDLREEIIEEVMNICYARYMEKQNAVFTAHCAAEAWLKLINWYFLRHDPGEEPSAYPPCYIPKRVESWVPDELPDPSPKDTWCKHQLNVQEDFQEEITKKTPSTSSLEMPAIEEIPEEYWFPGKVNLPVGTTATSDTSKISYSKGNFYLKYVLQRLRRRYVVEDINVIEFPRKQIRLCGRERAKDCSASPTTASPVWKHRNYKENVNETNAFDSLIGHQESAVSAKMTASVTSGSQQGAGDGGDVQIEEVPEGEMKEASRRSHRRTEKSKLFSKASMLGRSRGSLPPLDGDSRSRVSIISDCRLRNLRLDTQYDITSEKIDTPPGEMVKRK
ncbi:hypothetical protein KGM_213178 [Danaus plexippus plexippus]|uniref:Uncharacterized protein n=1 Tax=Danaus plexippus plexippus TaxID=278856 RepID=A0A212FAX1_DANPL|nr:hypothetical protein KGM_213178 [Danaus plexippus plexippus]